MMHVFNFLVILLFFNLFCQIDRLPSMVEHSRKLNKVNAYIEAFMRVRAVATVTDLKKCLVDLFNECEHFSDLRVGPIVKLVRIALST